MPSKTDKKKSYAIEYDKGLYMLVTPDGAFYWRWLYRFGGKKKELQLGTFPELSLADARIARDNGMKLLAAGADPQSERRDSASAPELSPPDMPPAINADLRKTTLPLIAYRLNNTPVTLVTGPTDREWMDQTANRFAYRCIPMLIANQGGWLALNPTALRIVWNGGQEVNALKIEVLGGAAHHMALSSFGSGIVTFTLPFLFRTPPGYNLLVQGPANYPKDGISPLSGIVETDWAESTFTMNWKVTRPHHPIIFEQGEPFCMITPQRRHETECFAPEIRDIESNPTLNADYLAWAGSRSKFNADLKIEGTQARKQGWQKHYAQGKTIHNKRVEAHQSKLKLREFKDFSKP